MPNDLSAAVSVMTTIDLRGASDWHTMLPRPDVAGEAPTSAVRAILAQVQNEGDAALLALTAQFDRVELDQVRVSADEISAAIETVGPDLVEHLRQAASGIEAFHRTQVRPVEDWANPETGVRIRSSWSPVRRAGCYVPGGRAAYPSTVLMTAIPAKIAGVEEVILCVPPSAEHGGVAPITLAAAHVAGVSEVYAVGGAQAIGAMAFGTESIAPVDVVCGPGNRFVAIAKQEVAGTVGVAAAFAGPSEVVVIADGSVPAEWVAIDIMVQAEHGPDGLGWLICWDEAVRTAVVDAIETLLESAPRAADIRATLASAGVCVLVDDVEHAVQVSDFIAPEHLQLMCVDADRAADLVRNAGAVFCGAFAPASIGDYAAGPSHVLPTHGSARFSSALTVDDFVRHHHVVNIDEAAFARLGPTVEALADAEGLTAHADSIRLRRGSGS